MEKVKNGKNLKEKVLFLMCLSALAGNISTEVYAENYDYTSIIGEKYNEEYKKYGTSYDGSVKIIEDKEININNEQGIVINNSGINGRTNPKLELDFTNKVVINTEMNDFTGVSLINSRGTKNFKVEFNNDVSIKNNIGLKGYAIYENSSGDTSSNAATASIIIVGAKDNTSKIQVIGNLGVQNEKEFKKDNIKEGSEEEFKAESSSTIELNLNSKDSFFAGKMLSEKVKQNKESDSKIWLEGNEKISLNLKNGATWYAHNSNGIDSYNISGEIKDALNGNLKTLITSNGGVIDIYNSTPEQSRINEITKAENYITKLKEGLNSGEIPEGKIEEVENMISYIEQEIEKIKQGGRTFTLNGVGDRLQNTTFRISTDVENKKSDKIVLNDVKVNKDKEIYFIEIAADPFESGEWKADKDDKILVMDINGTGLDKITVEGKEYEAEIGAGLVKQTITPTVEEDSNNKGDWYLTAIEKVENTAGNKGSGHIFAEIGAAANVGMAAAWRADSSDIYQRMGNLRNNEAEQGVWGRIYTGENEVRKGIGLDLEYRAVQIGYDRKEKTDEGKLFTGIAFGYFDGNADYDHGSGESNSATVGLYATYLGANGSFGDFIIKYGNLDNELSYTSESGDSYKADYDTYGFSADAEYGYRYMFDNDYYIEPLAQLSYVYIDDEDYTMNLNGKSGARVSNDSYQSLIGYAGFHYGKKFDDNVAYLRVAAAHEFMGDIDINAKYQDIKVNSSISGEDTWVEYGVGFDAKVKEDTAVYGRLQRSTGDVIRNKWHVSLGIRYTF